MIEATTQEITIMPIYEHTQPGTLLRVILVGCAIFAAGVLLLVPNLAQATALICLPMTIVLMICVLLFHALTVTVTSEELRLRFGIGLVWKRFSVSEIESARSVTNRWYYGWGIKWTPHGWLFNVSGFDAVEIQLKNGRKYRIGTDEPDELLAAIDSVIERT